MPRSAAPFRPAAYSQHEIGALLGLRNRVVRKLLDAPHIRRRHLYLPPADPFTGRIPAESPAELHAKFRAGALEIGVQAIERALRGASLTPADVDHLVCVTSTGFLVPGLSSLFTRELGFGHPAGRARTSSGWAATPGLNGMNPLVQWARTHPGRVALLVCCEINSAMYVADDTAAPAS